MPDEVARPPRDTRQTIIKTVTTPLGFFVLVILVFEVMFGILASTSQGPERLYLIVSMMGIVVLLVVIVACFAFIRPEALAGLRPPPPAPTGTTGSTKSARNQAAPRSASSRSIRAKVAAVLGMVAALFGTLGGAYTAYRSQKEDLDAAYADAAVIFRAGTVRVDSHGNIVPDQTFGQFRADVEPGSSGRYRVFFEPVMPCKPQIELLGGGNERLVTYLRLSEGGSHFTFDVETSAGRANPPFDVQFIAACRIKE